MPGFFYVMPGFDRASCSQANGTKTSNVRSPVKAGDDESYQIENDDGPSTLRPHITAGSPSRAGLSMLRAPIVEGPLWESETLLDSGLQRGRSTSAALNPPR